MAVVRKQQATVGTGEVQLVRQAGRFLLVQGDSAIDVTSIMGMVNYPLGCVTLRIRVSAGKRLSVRGADGTVLAELEPEAEPAAV